MSTIEWIFGSSPECDVWIPESTVSAQHCSLRKTSQGYMLRDLGSTNGTFVGGTKICKATAIKADTHVMLGGLIALPWPDTEGASRVVRFGRSAKNDFTIDAANVSTFHGKIVVGCSGTWVVVDMGSTNGVGLKHGHKFHVIRAAAMIGPNDTLLLGKTELRVQDISPLFRAPPPANPSRPPSSGEQRSVASRQPIAAPQPNQPSASHHASPSRSMWVRPAVWLMTGLGLLFAVLCVLLFALLR